jgi:hypothetical protein
MVWMENCNKNLRLKDVFIRGNHIWFAFEDGRIIGVPKQSFVGLDGVDSLEKMTKIYNGTQVHIKELDFDYDAYYLLIGGEPHA